MKLIPLSRGKAAIVDDEDYLRLSQHKWSLSSHGYAVRDEQIDGRYRRVYMHREILITTDTQSEVDHINGNGLYNRRENLRLATHMQNLSNQRKRSFTTSRFKGVYYDRATGKWRGQVKHSGKAHSLG